MAFDLTTHDKGRTETLLRDGKWHRLLLNGKSEYPIPPQDGFIQVDLFGRKGTGAAVIWLRFQRYPSMDSTAPMDFYKPTRAGAWGIHHSEHMTFKPGELYGIDYRIERGGPIVKVVNRILKGGHDG